MTISCTLSGCLEPLKDPKGRIFSLVKIYVSVCPSRTPHLPFCILFCALVGDLSEWDQWSPLPFGFWLGGAGGREYRGQVENEAWVLISQALPAGLLQVGCVLHPKLQLLHVTMHITLGLGPGSLSLPTLHA